MPHPSILIAYGAYGLRLVRTFLAGAASRGALVWDEETNIGSLNERRLQALSLFWLPDKVGLREQEVPTGILDGSSYELLDDLYSQIRMLDGSFDQLRESLAKEVDREKRRLLEARRHGEASVPGLDVFIIAQPTSQEVIGSLRDLMEPTMATLAADPSFVTVQGNTLLNFIEIFDFEDYWSPWMEPVRQALQRTIDEYGEAIHAGRQTIGRIYLFDGNTPRGRRSAESRLQEVVLFLEMMLLENLRNLPDARTLYERQNLKVAPVCTVGVRVVQRSSGLLKRLAAAAFARGWLDHIGLSKISELTESPFADLLKPFKGEQLAVTTGEPELRAAAFREIGEIEKRLLELSPDQHDWIDKLPEAARKQTETAILRLSQMSGVRSAQLWQTLLANFRERLEGNITVAMQERSPGFTLGAVIEELQRLEDEFAADAVAAKAAANPPAASNAAMDEVTRMQREYLLYRSRQVQTARLGGRWWPREAIVFAVGASPIFVRGTTDAFVNSSIPYWVQAGGSALLLCGLFWFFGRRFVQPWLNATVERAREFYTDTERGRLPERVRQAVHSSSIAGRIESYAEALAFGLKQSVLGAVAEELRSARTILMQRRDEVRWLHSQVGEFLLSNQVDEGRLSPTFHEGRMKSDVRFSLERNEDLEAVASSVPRTADRFREFVGSQDVFSLWSKKHADKFLHPLPFLDQLSDRFQDKLDLEPAEVERRARQIANFLANDAQVSVCFQWLATDALPPSEHATVFPLTWGSLRGVRAALEDAGFGGRVIESPNSERLYLFQTLLGVPAGLLVRSA